MPNKDFKIRPATFDDAEALSALEITARSNEVLWLYRYPYREQYPKEHQYYNTQRHLEFINPDSQFYVILIEVPDGDNAENMKPIAFAVWDLEHVPVEKGGKAKPKASAEDSKEETKEPKPLVGGGRPDMDPVRDRAFLTSIIAVKKTYMDDVYGDDILGLVILATHPDYQNQGAGRMLCQWGIDWSRERNLGHVGLFASPEGKRLYDKLGFKTVCELVARVEGEEEELRAPGMVLDL